MASCWPVQDFPTPWRVHQTGLGPWLLLPRWLQRMRPRNCRHHRSHLTGLRRHPHFHLMKIRRRSVHPLRRHSSLIQPRLMILHYLHRRLNQFPRNLRCWNPLPLMRCHQFLRRRPLLPPGMRHLWLSRHRLRWLPRQFDQSGRKRHWHRMSPCVESQKARRHIRISSRTE